MGDPAPSPRRLDSWKEIADYLGRDVRTAMRWAKRDGLPVQRVGSGARRPVFAYTSDIDAWLARGRVRTSGLQELAAAEPLTSVPTPGPRLWLWVGLGSLGTVAIVAFVAAGHFGPTRLPVARAAIVGRDVVGFDSRGGDIWRYRLGQDDETVGPLQVRPVHWTPSHPLQFLVPVQRLRGFTGGTGAVMLLDDAGRLQWQAALEDRLQFGGVEYASPWYPSDVVAYQVRGEWRISAAFHHHTWWPSILATFDRDGRLLDRFVNPGWLQNVIVTKDQRHLLASGMSNALGGAVLAVVDAAAPSGAAPGVSGTGPDCRNCPSGTPVAYFVLPWSDLARPSETPPVAAQLSSDGSIEFRAVQSMRREPGLPELILTIGPNLEMRHRTVSDSFADQHRALERQGALRHPFAQCPWKTPPVRKWTPAGGWEEIR